MGFLLAGCVRVRAASHLCGFQPGYRPFASGLVADFYRHSAANRISDPEAAKQSLNARANRTTALGGLGPGWENAPVFQTGSSRPAVAGTFSRGLGLTVRGSNVSNGVRALGCLTGVRLGFQLPIFRLEFLEK